MAKPIFLMGINRGGVTEEICKTIQKQLEEKLPDYHTFVYFTNSNEIEFKCFYEKDFEEINFEQLNKIITEQFKK